jgi:UDP-N-acetylglucosamine 1-carboxyvinyltransferase
VDATNTLLLAAVDTDGESQVENAAIKPNVIDFDHNLREMEAQIEGNGTRTLNNDGIEKHEPIEFRNCPDRIELGTFMLWASLAGEPGEPVTITNGETDHLGEEFLEAFRRTGSGLDIDGSTVTVTPPDTVQPVSIETAVYPGFPTDLQAQWTVLMTQADGNAVVKDTIYYDRFKHVPELQRMGAEIHVKENEAWIEGPAPLKGAQVMSTDLRASVSLVMAASAAKGRSDVLRIYHLDRGYEDLETKLNEAGLSIERVPYDEFKQPAPHIVD